MIYGGDFTTERGTDEFEADDDVDPEEECLSGEERTDCGLYVAAAGATERDRQAMKLPLRWERDQVRRQQQRRQQERRRRRQKYIKKRRRALKRRMLRRGTVSGGLDVLVTGR